MAEAATVVELLSFTAKVLKTCYDYIQKARSAPKEIQRILDDVATLKILLERLSAMTEDPDDQNFVSLKSLRREGGPFQTCARSLAELDEKLKVLGDASEARRRLQWPLTAKSIDKILDVLMAQKDYLYGALAGDAAERTVSTHDAVVDVKTAVLDAQAAEQRRVVLEWLSSPDPAVNHHKASSKREPGTCEWLTSSAGFQKWRGGPNQLLWLHAFPGAGKTFMAASAIDFLLAETDGAQTAVVYYYFDFNNPAQQSHSGFLRSLLRQLCARGTVVPAEAVSLREECRGAAPSDEQLLGVIGALAGRQRTYIVIDALDECVRAEEEDDRASALAALRYVKDLGLSSVSVFVTSRPEPDIVTEMETLCDVDVDVQTAEVDEDIRRHVRSCLAQDGRLKRWPQNIKDEIEQKLMKDSGGMFRWVVCQLAELRKCLKPAGIRSELRNLPKTLSATYARILNRVPDLYQAELRTILMLLAFSARPVTIQEVAEAAAVDLESGSFSTDGRFATPFDILELCSSLVTLSEVTNYRPYVYVQPDGAIPDGTRQLQFAHFSVKEYLVSEQTKNSVPGPFRFSDPLAQSYITQISLIYLLDFNGGRKMTREDHADFPFLDYAALYWTKHLGQLQETDRGPVESLLLRLFDPQNENHLLNVLNVHNPANVSSFSTSISRGPISRNKDDFEPPLYYASLYGLQPIVRFLLAGLKEEDESQQDVLSTALRGAARGGEAEITRLLLDSGADPAAHRSGDVLYAAASGGNLRVVEMLIASGAPIRPLDAQNGSALHEACRLGHAAIAQALIDYGFDPYGRCHWSGMALSSAIMGREYHVAAALVAAGIDVNRPPDGYFNALAQACELAGIDTVRLLLDHGAAASLKRPGSKALPAAARRGDVELMRLLLDHGADINCSTDDFYGTPLKGAIDSKMPEALEFVLSRGADVNLKGEAAEYPVDLAIFSGNLAAADRLLGMGARFGDMALEQSLSHRRKEHLLKVLLDRGADPNTPHQKEGNMLQYAVLTASADAVRTLLEAGADPNEFTGGKRGSPLLAALYRDDVDIVRLLLQHGASLSPTRYDDRYENPLSRAAGSRHDDLVRILLDHGAQVNRGGKTLGAPLQVAAAQGAIDHARLLVGRGADVNAWGGEYGTALRAALAQDHEEVARFLLDSGADYAAERPADHCTAVSRVAIETYRSALEVAAATNNTKLVQLLESRGLDLNASAGSCSRALQRAAEMPDMTMLEYLIRQGADVRAHGGRAMAMSPYNRFPRRLERTKLLLQHGASADGSPETSSTPLLNSIILNDTELMELLLASGCDVNAGGELGLMGCALGEAVERAAVGVVKRLLGAGADPNLRCGRWGTPFMSAVAKGDEEIFHLLLQHGAAVNLAPPFGHFGTPLATALEQGYYGIAHELIDRGADIHALGRFGSALTPVIRAGGVGQMAMLERLLSLGADLEAVDPYRPGDDEPPRRTMYLTPMQVAAYGGRDDLIALLADKGAAVNPLPPRGRFGSPLQAAAYAVKEKTVSDLLGRGANVNAVGGAYGTALQAAVSEGSDVVIQLLLDAGADPSLELAESESGSPLQASAVGGVERRVRLLLERGAPANNASGAAVGKYGCALAAAAKLSRLEVVKALLAAGADVNFAGGKYGRPLQAACCSKGSRANRHGVDTIRLLLEAGAEVDAAGAGKYGTALQAAAAHRWEYVELLLEKGADPNARGGKYGCALEAAVQKGHLRAEKALLKAGALE